MASAPLLPKNTRSRPLCSTSSEQELRDGVELVGGLYEGVRLLGERMRDDGMTVPQIIDGPPGHKVEIFFPIGVPHAAALPAYEHHGLAPHGLRIVTSSVSWCHRSRRAP